MRYNIDLTSSELLIHMSLLVLEPFYYFRVISKQIDSTYNKARNTEKYFFILICIWFYYI